MSGALSPMLRKAAMPAAWAYERIIEARNARYDRSAGVQRLDRPVISIGNMSVGGTGKTPMVMWVVNLLRESGYQPAIAMRGYGARDGELSDEQAEYQWRLPGVHVVADPRRYEAMSHYLQSIPAVDCVVMDDGFQHRQLHRDLDLLLIDATADTFHDSLLPAGRLREPLKNMARADGVVITRACIGGEINPTIEERVLHYHGKPPIAWTDHRWGGLLVIDAEGERREPVSWLTGQRVMTMLGVGNPTSLERQIEAGGARIIASIPARDHERYDRAKLTTARGLCSGAEGLIVTGKDWVKLRRLIDWKHWPCPLVVPELTVEVWKGADALKDLIEKTIRSFDTKQQCQAASGEPSFMTSLLEQLARYEPFTVMVIGDFMLDQAVYGAAERLSPDAPVPVLHATKFEHHAGGASNVALCLHALKGDVKCFGVTGDDSEGKILREELSKAGCDISGLLVDASRPTTIKRSLIGLAQHRHPQKMFRVDMESREPLSDHLRDTLLAVIESQLPRVDVVAMEDYNKGVCCQTVCRAVIEMCRKAGKPVLIDPAAIEDYRKYRGATAITPNRSEAELATGLDTPLDADDLHNAGLTHKLLKELDLDAVVVTLDRHGAMIEERGGAPMLLPTVARSVYDVSGAGDMVLAALAGAVANRFNWPDAVRFANAAAGLEVEVFGVQPIPFSRVQREIMAHQRTLHGKVRTAEELAVELAVHRESGHKIVLTNGCFDVIHVGHLFYLREAARCGDVLVVGVNSDRQVKALKGGGRPVFSEDERLEILSEFESINYLIVFHERTAEQLIKLVKPDLYVKGGDYEPQEIVEYPLLKDLGIEVRVLSHREGLSTTEVIDRFTRAYGAQSTSS